VKILFLTSRLPYPPYRGDRVRTWNFVRSLSARHDVRLLSFTEGAADDDGVRELSKLAAVETVRLSRTRSFANMGLGLLSPLPYQVLYYRSAAMERAVAGALRRERFDVVVVHLFRMAPFALPALPAAGAPRSGPVMALDLTDAVSAELRLSLPRRPLLLRPAYRWECDKIRRYEGRAASVFDEVWTISESDRQAILGVAAGASVAVVPNGVDESLFAGAPGGAGSAALFVGNFDVPHNIDAARHLARDIMPLVRAAEPGAVLRLVGHGRLDRLRLGDPGRGVEARGFVPSLADAYAGAAVFVAPLRFAAGVQNKVIEAMASGLPVVTTSLVNRGLGAADGDEIVVRDEPGAFAEAVVGLLRDGERARRLGDRGRAFVRARFTWNAVVDRVEALAARRARG
jgi:glycosyltransferase involved in cell wall biosynthesis